MSAAIITLIGNLVRDPELGNEYQGQKICHFRMAHTPRTGKRNANGEYESETNYYDCSAFGTLADYAMQRLQKGTLAVVNGKLSATTYQKNDGTTGVNLRINVSSLEAAANGKNTPQQSAAPQRQPATNAKLTPVVTSYQEDEELPF